MPRSPFTSSSIVKQSPAVGLWNASLLLCVVCDVLYLSWLWSFRYMHRDLTEVPVPVWKVFGARQASDGFTRGGQLLSAVAQPGLSASDDTEGTLDSICFLNQWWYYWLLEQTVFCLISKSHRKYLRAYFHRRQTSGCPCMFAPPDIVAGRRLWPEGRGGGGPAGRRPVLCLLCSLWRIFESNAFRALDTVTVT